MALVRIFSVRLGSESPAVSAGEDRRATHQVLVTVVITAVLTILAVAGDRSRTVNVGGREER
jgi:hypothetical protein